MEKTTTYIRQGDVTLRYLGPPQPGGPKPKVNVLATGEQSGHWHEMYCSFVPMSDGAAGILDLFEPGYLRVGGQPTRHLEIEVPPGRYELLRQQEYVPGAVPRDVID